MTGIPPDRPAEEILDPVKPKPSSPREAIVEARPDVYNHNLETVPRLYPTIRPGARYYASLRLLESVKRHDPSIFTKSGIMVGLGEERNEILQLMDDLRSADVDFITIGQYLQPTPHHHPVLLRVAHDLRRSSGEGAGEGGLPQSRPQLHQRPQVLAARRRSGCTQGPCRTHCGQGERDQEG